MLKSAARLPASGSGYYHHHDALGNVVALTSSSSGALIESYTYDSFGKRTVYNATGQQIPDTAYANTHGYTGREHLPLSGLMDYRNRSYSTTLGRFFQTDPIRFDAGDVNLYRYVGNNSKNLIDPYGLQGTRSRQMPCCRGVPYNKRKQCCVSGIIFDKIKRHKKLGLSLGECVGRYTLDPFESMTLGGFSIGIGFKNPWIGAGVAALVLIDQAEATNRCLELVCP